VGGGGGTTMVSVVFGVSCGFVQPVFIDCSNSKKVMSAERVRILGKRISGKL